jgi:hypothetical protein
MKMLLTREQFNKRVLDRDKRCVVCSSDLDLAIHHIMDRSLFEDGGYYEDNGVALCPKHHRFAEDDTLSCDELRELAGIINIILPEGYDPEQVYNKWGIVILNKDYKGTLYQYERDTLPSFEKNVKKRTYFSVYVDKKYAESVLGVQTESDNLLYVSASGRIPCSCSRQTKFI